MMMREVVEVAGEVEPAPQRMPTPARRLTPILLAPSAGDKLLVSCDTYFAIGDRISGPEKLAIVIDSLMAKDTTGLLHMQALGHTIFIPAGTPVLVIRFDDGIVELRIDLRRRTGKIENLELFRLYGVKAQLSRDPNA